MIDRIVDHMPAIDGLKGKGEADSDATLFSKSCNSADEYLCAKRKAAIVQSYTNNVVQMFYNAVKRAVEFVPLLGGENEYTLSKPRKAAYILMSEIENCMNNEE